jgi:drug/metabolite transporter (DMT)-like permease
MIYILLFFQQLIASTTHLVAQDVSHEVDPGVVLLFRALFASLLFLPIIVAMEKRMNIFARIERVDIAKFVLLGALNVPVNQLLYLHGMKFTTPANSALLYAMTPAMVFVIGLKSGRSIPTLWKTLGIVIAFTGAAILMFERGATLQSEHTVGNILIFVAVIAWSFYTILGSALVQKYGAVYTTGANMIIGTLLYIPIAIYTSSASEIAHLGRQSWLEILYLAAMASVVNYLLWFYALSKLETTRVAVFQNLQPVLTTVLALFLGKVVMTFQLAGGGILALIGVALVQLTG